MSLRRSRFYYCIYDVNHSGLRIKSKAFAPPRHTVVLSIQGISMFFKFHQMGWMFHLVKSFELFVHREVMYRGMERSENWLIIIGVILQINCKMRIKY